MTKGVNELMEAAVGITRKRYGDGAIMRGNEGPIGDIDVIPTGSLALDHAIGVGGIPRGRIIEIFSWESAGKTTLCQHIIANAQKLGECLYIDMEHALDPEYMVKTGVDYDKLFISQPNSGEQALQIADDVIRSGGVVCVVVDSVSALVPESELKGDMGDLGVGMQSRLMGQAMRKLAAITKKNNVALIFTNQLRHDIGKFTPNPNISPETTSGGNALKFYASVRIKLRRKYDDEGQDVIAKVLKNKVAAPFKEAEMRFVYNVGIDQEQDLFNYAFETGVVERKGAYYHFAGNKWQGKDNTIEAIKGDPELLKALTKEVRGGRG